MPEWAFLPLAVFSLGYAFARKPGRIVGLLFAGLIASQFLHASPTINVLIAGGAFIDFLAIVALGEPFTQHPNKRAYSVGLIGGGKMVLATWAYSRITNGEIPYSDYALYAWILCIGYLMQVCVAGGFLDAVGRWLDLHLRHAVPRRYHALWHVES